MLSEEEIALLGDQEQVTEHDLRVTFRKLLRNGVVLLQHHGDTPGEKIRLCLGDHDILAWDGGGFEVAGSRRVSLHDVVCIEVGRQNGGFTSCSYAVENVSEDLCFSLVTSNASLDLEASSLREREALAQGFIMLHAHLESTPMVVL